MADFRPRLQPFLPAGWRVGNCRDDYYDLQNEKEYLQATAYVRRRWFEDDGQDHQIRRAVDDAIAKAVPAGR